MEVGYVEKSFETYINAELLSKYGAGWAPGQNEEGFVGFDLYFNMTFLKNILRFGHLYRYCKGVYINDILHHVEQKYSIILRELPHIKVNMLLQYKCPKYLTKKNANEWFYWQKPYYRYDIDCNQQSLIQNIYDSFSDVLILYAAPAINSAAQLYEYSIKKKIVKNTNFTEGYKLTGHGVNTYLRAGKTSCAFSKPENIESFDFEQLKKMYNIKNDIDNIEYCIRFSNQIKSLVDKFPDLSQGYKALLSIYTDNGELRVDNLLLVDSLLTVSIFKELTGITRFFYI